MPKNNPTSITQNCQEEAKRILLDLNTEQKQAVTHENGPLLIVAGAGTGKTTVITRRIAWLILKKNIKPDEILALTFTDKAAGEMEERVDRILPYGYVNLWISTFHAFAERILKAHALDIGLPADVKLLDTTQTWMLVRKNLNRFDLNYYRPLGNPTKFIHALLTHFSRLKDELVSPQEYLEYVESITLDTDSDIIIGGKTVSGEVRKDEIARLKELANAYHVYEQLLLEQNALDFGSLLMRTVELFKKRPQILKQYQDQFKYVLVDEFQDTNIAQYELVKLLTSSKNNLTVVGDDDQCLPAGTKIATPYGACAVEQLKRNDEVLTAVGKGYVWTSHVKRVMKNKKTVRILSITTEKGSRLEVTDNHKMFCYVPRVDDGSRTYVYIMYSRLYGWRIGVTNDLATRLRLERGADKIIGLRSFETSEEAKYYEMLWMLTYQIPPVCFKERGKASLHGERLKRLFNEIDTETNARRLAKDLGIDLSSHHYALDSVSRGNGKRVKIHFELCARNYTVKQRQPCLLKNPQILHQVSLETSQKDVIKKLQSAGIAYQRIKKGIRVRETGIDIVALDRLVKKLVTITGGFVEYAFNVGKIHTQSLRALAMPAGNILEGHFLPVKHGSRILYEKVISVQEARVREEVVYDLEIEKTYNFIANNIVVHNSIYKFRGASLSNILEFKKDFPDAKEIFLTHNYRSKQAILDTAYGFIQQNNPNRLEIQLGKAGLTKKLLATKGEGGVVQHLHAESLHDEARMVLKTILELRKKDPHTTWNDFAILVRANDHAGIFIRTFDEAGVPYELVTARGLYSKPVILDLVAYAHLLDDPYDNPSAYRVLTSPISTLNEQAVSKLLYWSGRKGWSVLETLRRAGTLELNAETVAACNHLVHLIEKHVAAARRIPASKIFFTILEDTGYLKLLSSDDELNQDALRHLNQFYRKLSTFETRHPEPTLRNFLVELALEIESGEQGRIELDPNEGPESIKILTCHAAKGLEFSHVFVTHLVDRRFPTSERKDPIEIPDALVKEHMHEGEVHLEEERRLFYVACTRAQEGLFFTSANDYGGIRKKKPSRFLIELQALGMLTSPSVYENEQRPERIEKETETPKGQTHSLPRYFSYTKLKAFETCPLQYKFSHIIKIPVRGRPTFSFGKSIHATLQKFCERVQNKDTAQTRLFDTSTPAVKNLTLPTLKELYDMYDSCWIDDWFDNEKQQKEYYEKGKKILKHFYKQAEQNLPNPKYLEKVFHLKINGYTMKGVIDRVDEKPDNTFEIIDYKTGASKKEKNVDKDQLYIYQIAMEEVLGKKPSALTYYYVEDGTQISFLGTSEQLEKVKQKIRGIINEMRTSNFPATQAKEKCSYCDFKNICQFRIL